MAIDFFVFFGALLVVNGVMGSLFVAVGWIEPATPVKSGTTEAPVLFSVGRLVLNSVGMMGATLIMMGILALRQNQTWSRVGWTPRGGDILLGFKASLLILPPTMLLMGLVSTLQKYSHPVLNTLKSSDAGTDYSVFAVLFFTTAIVTPFVEEFWFRGLLQGGLQRLADMRFRGDQLSAGPSASFDESDPSLRADWTPIAIWPMVVASLVFALMHWGQGLAPIPLFFLSLGLGYLYRQTGSLIPSIVVHFVLNGFTMTATLLELLRAA